MVPKSLSSLRKSGVDLTDDVNFVQLKINIETETLEVVSEAAIPIAQLTTAISSTSPRYSFYRYTHENNGVTCSPLFFIYTCPSTAKVKERMLYAASSRSVQQLAHQIGLKTDNKMEGYPTDMTEENLLAELYPKVDEIKRFDRPRRPGATRAG